MKKILAIVFACMLTFLFTACNREQCVEKPVIYLYPIEDMDVHVSLDYNGELTCTYPEYNNGWNVHAKRDGTLINYADDKEYSYLFWEGESTFKMDFSEGFVVKGTDTKDFLERTLTEMGLNAKESNDFIVYWLPRMQHNAYNLISFQEETYTDNAKLNISPKPDSMLRVFMAFKPLSKPISVKPQELKTFDRSGFTVVEWGGVEIQ